MKPGERGFALGAALAALAAFGAISFAVIAADQGNLASVSAMRERARLSAAADAALALAVAGVASGWPIDGTERRLPFDGMTLRIAIEDERGKLRLNDMEAPLLRRMFEEAGAGGREVDELVAAVLDWRDADGDTRPDGAEAADYPEGAALPRNGDFRSVSELASVKGMTPELYARIAPAATVFFGESGAFSPATASPFARAVMGETGGEEDRALKARPLTVRVTVEDGAEGTLRRATIIEFPNGPGRDWLVRYREDL